MKKRQIGVLGIVIWQAITLVKKDPTLREKIQETPGILGKIKILGEKRLQNNKELIEDIKATDRDKTVNDIESDLHHDGDNIGQWIENQSDKDRETQWHETIRKITWNIPDKKTLADWREKYKQSIIQRWNNL